jgi:hypothetical protein
MMDFFRIAERWVISSKHLAISFSRLNVIGNTRRHQRGQDCWIGTL